MQRSLIICQIWSHYLLQGNVQLAKGRFRLMWICTLTSPVNQVGKVWWLKQWSSEVYENKKDSFILTVSSHLAPKDHGEGLFMELFRSRRRRLVEAQLSNKCAFFLIYFAIFNTIEYHYLGPIPTKPSFPSTKELHGWLKSDFDKWPCDKWTKDCWNRTLIDLGPVINKTWCV